MSLRSRPFHDPLPLAGLSPALSVRSHTAPAPGTGFSLSACKWHSCCHRRQLHLQRVACRYRGVGSPFAAELAPCTTEELTAYYTKITKASDPPSFVDPASRPTDRKGRAKLGSAWSHSVKHERNKNRRPPPPAKSDAAVTPVNEPVPPVTHTLWLAAPDSDEFMVRGRPGGVGRAFRACLLSRRRPQKKDSA